MIKLLIIIYSLLTIWMLLELFKYFYGDRLKAYIKLQIEILEAEKVHRLNQQNNKLKELESSKVLEVEVEEVNGLEWSVLYNEKKTKYKVIDITIDSE
jgi:hypothetical protein